MQLLTSYLEFTQRPEGISMSKHFNLPIVAIISNFLLIFIMLYFKYFPMLISSYVTNIFIFMSILFFIMALVYGSLNIKKSTDVLLFLPQTLIFVFVSRAIPNLRLSYPPLHDPYFHYVSTLNIFNHYTLEPVLSWWYSGVNGQLHWPIMHLNTISLAYFTDIDLMQIFRFQEPFIGVIFFLSVFCLTKTITKNAGISLLAGLFASINDIIIFYQSEYHPQGISMVYFMLIIFVFVKSKEVSTLGHRYLLLVLAATFMLTHYFTPLFLSLIFSLYVAIYFILLKSTLVFESTNRDNMFPNVSLDFNYLFIIIISSISYHLFAYDYLLKCFLDRSVSMPVLSSNLISVGSSEIPWLTSILTSSKWGIFLLAVISLLWTLKTKNRNELSLGLLMGCIIVAGIVGNYILASPLNRIIGFYVPFAAFFAALTVYRFMYNWFVHIDLRKKSIFCSLVVSLLLTSSFFNAYQPSFYFQDSKIDTYYWYSNRLPKMDEYVVAGDWFGSHISNNVKVGTEFDTRVIPFYYGKHNADYIRVLYNKYVDPYSNKYVMVNPNIPYSYTDNRKKSFDKTMNVIYFNDEIKVYLILK